MGGPHAGQDLDVGCLAAGQGARHRGGRVGGGGGGGPGAGGAAGEELGGGARAVAGRVDEDQAADEPGAPGAHDHGGGRAHGVADEHRGRRRDQTQGDPAAPLGVEVLQDGDDVVDQDLPGALQFGGRPARGQAVTAGVHGDHPVAPGGPVVDGVGLGGGRGGDPVQEHQGGGVVGPDDNAGEIAHGRLLDF